MPQIFLPVKESIANATRPIVYGIINDIFSLTDIPADSMISFPGDLGAMQQPGTELTNLTPQAGVNTMPFSNRVFIEVEEDYEMDRVLSTATYRAEYPFLFRDDRIEVGIKPVYCPTDLTINFKFRSMDKVAAMRWRDNIKTRVSMNWDQRIHLVSYHYLIPMEFLIVLKEIHRLMENVEGYDVPEFEDYFKSGVTKRATILTTQSGTKPAWAIQESQIKIVGSFDFDLVPEKGSREDEVGTWTIAFAYKLKFEKPLACIMRYPIMIHNQLLDQKYRNNPLTDKLDPLKDKTFGFSLSSQLFSYFERDNYNARSFDVNGWKGVSIPSFDEFIPASVLPSTTRVFTALINIDRQDPHKLLSLKNLGDFALDADVLKFMVGEIAFMTTPGMSIFAISAYRGNLLLDNAALTLDSDLNVYSTYVLTLRKYYHIRLSVVNDLSMLSAAALDRLRNFGKAALVILNYIDPRLVANGQLPAILANDYITREAMLNAVSIMTSLTRSGIANNGVIGRPNSEVTGIYASNNTCGGRPAMKTVQSLVISSNKIETLQQ